MSILFVCAVVVWGFKDWSGDHEFQKIVLLLGAFHKYMAIVYFVAYVYL